MSNHPSNDPLQVQAHKLSHDLKNPLAAAREFVSLLLDQVAGPTTPLQHELLESALECCDNMNEIINTWLAEVDHNGQTKRDIR